MCNYCNSKGDLNIFKNRDDNYPSREIYVYINYNNLAIETYSSDEQDYFDSIEINYCPMCGVELH